MLALFNLLFGDISCSTYILRHPQYMQTPWKGTVCWRQIRKQVCMEIFFVGIEGCIERKQKKMLFTGWCVYFSEVMGEEASVYVLLCVLRAHILSRTSSDHSLWSKKHVASWLLFLRDSCCVPYMWIASTLTFPWLLRSFRASAFNGK